MNDKAKMNDVPNADLAALDGVTRNPDGTYNIDRPGIVARDLYGIDVVDALGLPSARVRFIDDRD